MIFEFNRNGFVVTSHAGSQTDLERAQKIKQNIQIYTFIKDYKPCNAHLSYKISKKEATLSTKNNLLTREQSKQATREFVQNCTNFNRLYLQVIYKAFLYFRPAKRQRKNIQYKRNALSHAHIFERVTSILVANFLSILHKFQQILPPDYSQRFPRPRKQNKKEKSQQIKRPRRH